MSQLDLRPRSTSDIIDAAFVLYRRDPGQYLMLAAIAAAPGLIFNLAMFGGAPTIDPEHPTSYFYKLLPGILVGLLTYALSSAVIQRIGSRAFLGQDSDVGAIVREVVPLVPRMIVALLIVTLFAMLALICFIFPVFYVAARYFAVSSVIAIEESGPIAALGRSSSLTKGQKGHVLITLVLVYAIGMALSAGVGLLAGMLPTTALPLVAATAFGIVLQPVLLLTTMLLYYDLRIRNEGFDLEHMSSSLGVTGAPAAGAAY